MKSRTTGLYIFIFICLALAAISCKKSGRVHIFTITNYSSRFVNLTLYIAGQPHDYEINDGASIVIDHDKDGNSYVELSDSAHIYFDHFRKLQIHSKYTGDDCPGSTLYAHPLGETIKLYCENFYESVTYPDANTKAFVYVIDTTDYIDGSIDIH